MTITGNDFPVRANAFCLSSEKRASSTQMSPAGTLCFDIFSPLPGDNDVISQVERLSSNEMKIAPRSLRMALGGSGRSAIICMAVSRVGDRNLTLPERRSLSTSPWDLEVCVALNGAASDRVGLEMFPNQFVWISIRRIGRNIEQPQGASEACDERRGLLSAMRWAAIDDQKDR